MQLGQHWSVSILSLQEPTQGIKMHKKCPALAEEDFLALLIKPANSYSVIFLGINNSVNKDIDTETDRQDTNLYNTDDDNEQWWWAAIVMLRVTLNQIFFLSIFSSACRSILWRHRADCNADRFLEPCQCNHSQIRSFCDLTHTCVRTHNELNNQCK